MTNAKQTEESMLAELAAAHAAYIHYDNYPWQVGGVFVAGAFAFWGFVVSADQPANAATIFAASVLVTAIMSAWLLRCAHNRQLYTYHLHTVHELEALLGMKNHSRFKSDVYKLDLPRGHQLNYFMYVLTSLGGPYLHWFTGGSWVALLTNAALVVIVVWWADAIGERAKRLIKTIPPRN
jgi:hypothetical protein